MDASNHSPLNVALAAAQRAGEVLRRALTRTRIVHSKGFRDMVTDADLAAQEVIVRELTAAFPGHRILTEEDPRAVDWADPTPTWVIDPLDGTSNFVRQIPLFGVSIGLVAAGEVKVGVIHDPLQGESFFAERGGGSFRRAGRGRAKRVQVSALDTLTDAAIGMGWPRDPALRRRVNDATARVGAACQTLRATGSAALGFAYVACGRFDGLYHLALQPWDVAAGALLV
ncbi:MAG: inositol monophosphatase family protein, partial [Anaerolineales bacterium]